VTVTKSGAPGLERRSVVVELCGLPGAGKTTLAADVVDRLQRSGLDAVVADATISAAVPFAQRSMRKLGLLASTVAVRPGEALRAARQLGAGQPSRRDRLAVPVQWCVTSAVMSAAGRRPGLSVLEEGLVQALWSAQLGARSPYAADVRRMLAYRSGSATPDLVVHLDVPVEVALARLRARESRHSRVQRMSDAQQIDVLGHGDWLLRRILAAWTDLGCGPVLSLRQQIAPSPNDDVATRLADHLRRLTNTERPETGSWRPAR
jgi:AAA domain